MRIASFGLGSLRLRGGVAAALRVGVVKSVETDAMVDVSPCGVCCGSSDGLSIGDVTYDESPLVPVLAGVVMDRWTSLPI